MINQLRTDRNFGLAKFIGVVEEIAEQFQIELAKLAEEATERCRNEREKAEKFIRESLEGMDAAGQVEAESLRNQIAALQASL